MCAADILSTHEQKSQQKAKKNVRLQRDANVLLKEVRNAHTEYLLGACIVSLHIAAAVSPGESIHCCVLVCLQVQKRFDDIRRSVAQCDPQNRPVPPTLQEP